MTSEVGVDVRRAWLEERVDRRVAACLDDALVAAVELLASATGDAATLRSLTADGRSLVPVTAHHPDPVVSAAMLEVMGRSVEPADSGLWRPVVRHQQPRRYEVGAQQPPEEASPQQRDFMARFPVRAVLGVPVLEAGRVLGGVALVRYTDPRPFTDADEVLVAACALRVAPLLAARDVILRLREAAAASA